MSDELRLIEALKDLIPALEVEAAEEREAREKKEAEERLVAIKRAYGSTVSSHEDDEIRVASAVEALKDAITTLNSRARKLEALRAEAAALANRFALPAPTLATVSEPTQNVGASLPTPWRHHVVRPSIEQCEHNLRQRRDYVEISGSPGYSIIMAAGLQPFRPLSEREREVLEDRSVERRPDPVLAQAVTEANALGNVGVPGGDIHRG